MQYRPKDDHYVTLQVPATATTDDIKRAHRALIRECHPDKATGDHDRATRLNHARDVLLDPDQRAAYDDARLQHRAKRAANIQRPQTARPKRRYDRTPPPNPADVAAAELIAALKNRSWGRAFIWGLLGLAAAQNEPQRPLKRTRRPPR